MSKPNNAVSQLAQNYFSETQKQPQNKHQNVSQAQHVQEFQDFLQSQTPGPSSSAPMSAVRHGHQPPGFLAAGPSRSAGKQPQWAQEFQRFQGPAVRPGPSVEEMETIYTRGAARAGPALGWAQEFHRQDPAPGWANEFRGKEKEWEHEFQAQREHLEGKMVSDGDWSRQFEAMRMQERLDSDPWAKEFEQRQSAAEAQGEKTEDWQAQFEALWQKMAENPKNQTHGDWEKEFRNIMPDLHPADLDTGDIPADWEVDPVKAELQPYTFEPNNPFLTHPNPFQAGMELLATQGSLSAAALAFEAAVQRDPHNDVAWHRLGTTQVENEKESPGIAALQ
ncbi:Peroxisomal membrane signal receptor PTS1, partial [Kappamyces sp. JEL0680]